MNLLRLKSHDWVITIIISLLLFIGTVVIYSTTLYSVSEAQGAGTLPKQLIFIIIGVSAYFLLSLVDFSWLQTRAILVFLYIAIIAFLIFVVFFGENIAGTNRWIDIGFFSFQPSEYAKIVLILVTAAIFTIEEKVVSNKTIKFNKSKGKALKGYKSILERVKQLWTENTQIRKYTLSILTALPIVVLTLIQPSLGNAVILLLLWVMLLFVVFPKQHQLLLIILIIVAVFAILAQLLQITRVEYTLSLEMGSSQPNLVLIGVLIASVVIGLVAGRLKPYMFVIIPLIGAVLFSATVFGWNNILTNYQKDRIDTFVQGPESDPLGTGYQVRQSKVAIGAGRFYGRGFLQGTQSNLNVLTQAHTDFVFASLSEQFGFLGGGLALILYLILIFRILRIGSEATSEFGTVVAVGVAVLLLLHVLINIGMNMGKLPVTGIPLPLVSYGGSSVFVTLISLGIVQSISGSKRAVDISDSLMLRSLS
ncbi:MAG: FtsW/RodA/SpoVE family cell cycle protein [Candidatus Dojkabacteria bacterium]